MHSEHGRLQRPGDASRGRVHALPRPPQGHHTRYVIIFPGQYLFLSSLVKRESYCVLFDYGGTFQMNLSLLNGRDDNL